MGNADWSRFHHLLPCEDYLRIFNSLLFASGLWSALGKTIKTVTADLNGAVIGTCSSPTVVDWFCPYPFLNPLGAFQTCQDQEKSYLSSIKELIKEIGFPDGNEHCQLKALLPPAPRLPSWQGHWVSPHRGKNHIGCLEESIWPNVRTVPASEKICHQQSKMYALKGPKDVQTLFGKSEQRCD